MSDGPRGYSRLHIWLHWITAGLVALQYLFHEAIAEAFDRGLEGGEMAITGGAAAHMAGGTLILGLAMWRLILRNERGVPDPPAAEPGWAAAASHWAHRGFYVLLLLLPVTGAVAWATASEGAGNAHEVLRALLMLLILAHIGAVVVHQLVWKTGIMTRMTRPDA